MYNTKNNHIKVKLIANAENIQIRDNILYRGAIIKVLTVHNNF